MAPRLPDPAGPAAGGRVPADALAAYLRFQATEFLRALGPHQGSGAARAASADTARALRRAARRISGTLHTFRTLLEETWAEQLRPELAWLSGTLAREHALQERRERLLLALHRLSPQTQPPDGTPSAHRDAPALAPPAPPAGHHGTGDLTVGAARAGALLDRRLTLARARAHSEALQALGSARFHALADQVAVLAGDVPLAPGARGADLRAAARSAEERLTDAVAALPLITAGSPYNASALADGLSPQPAPHPQDAPWHQVRLLLRLHRYAREVLHGEAPADSRLPAASRALDRHRDAAEAAAAAAAAARTPRIAPATAYVLGVLHADQRHAVEAARFAFQRAWLRRPVGAGRGGDR
ncbi:CHAD domain-containing protein [Streptomyces thermodiastaticus]|uniref:CHAD domain-containing protein n=1 Tax=Streptomyces thermodiastaticus TaxID=44061 RepID=UPI00167554DB|nr:CHAD domain-containing protein [Streptomyces thermodiastaticus]MCE7550604.1 CHAD domain-containing protein [Streptomyces thermodiastaticus]GHF70503.1 CHAD domain-containing protein [Streptomyces thermodiastaticus]